MVRRVQAVIEVPIKEGVEEEGCELNKERPPDAGVLQDTSTPTGGGDVRRRKSSGRSHRWTEVARLDYVDKGKEAPVDEAAGGEYIDGEVGENAGMGTLTMRGKTVLWGRKYARSQMRGTRS